MSGLFELDDFEETRVEWEPVWERRIQDMGWRWSDESRGEGATIPLHEDGTRVTREEWSAYVSRGLCRDCGVKCSYNQGGASSGGLYQVCDDCAQLDGCLTRQHDRGPEWHVSHWGMLHRAEEHEARRDAQAKRRARYLARAAA